MGKTQEFKQACGLLSLVLRYPAVGAIRCAGIGQCIVVLYGFDACRYPVHGGKWEIQTDM